MREEVRSKDFPTLLRVGIRARARANMPRLL